MNIITINRISLLECWVAIAAIVVAFVKLDGADQQFYLTTLLMSTCVLLIFAVAGCAILWLVRFMITDTTELRLLQVVGIAAYIGIAFFTMTAVFAHEYWGQDFQKSVRWAGLSLVVLFICKFESLTVCWIIRSNAQLRQQEADAGFSHARPGEDSTDVR